MSRMASWSRWVLILLANILLYCARCCEGQCGFPTVGNVCTKTAYDCDGVGSIYPSCTGSFTSCQEHTTKQASCRRFDKCSVGKFRQPYDATAVCEECKDGYEMVPDESGDCNHDVNECLGENECFNSQCKNNWGSYTCSCDTGHEPERGSPFRCTESECGEKSVAYATVTPSNATHPWIYKTSAYVACDDIDHVVDGPAYLQCQASSEDGGVAWYPDQPTTCRQDEEYDRWAETFHVRISMLSYSYSEEDVMEGYTPRSTAYHLRRQASSDPIPAYLDRVTTTQTGYEIHDGVVLGGTMTRLNKENSAGFRAEANVAMYTSLDQEDSLDNWQDLVDVMIGESLGCFTEENLVNWQAFTLSTGENLAACNQICHENGYDYFAIKVSQATCMCHKMIPDLLKKSGDELCDQGCSVGSRRQCGGTNHLSVYQVAKDQSLGYCYIGSHDNNRLLPADAQRTTDGCMEACREAYYQLAHVGSDGVCSCGNIIPDSVTRNISSCQQACTVSNASNCVKGDLIRIFATYPGYYVTAEDTDLNPMTTKIYDSSYRVTGVTTALFRSLPGLRHFATERIILYSSTPVYIGDVEDVYSETCGNQVHTDTPSNQRGDVTLRAFHLRLSNLKSYFSEDTQRAYIYAQTVVMDADLELDFSLLIRATQIVIPAEKDFHILVDFRAPFFGPEYAVDAVRELGPPRDRRHMKDSLMCARLLTELAREPSTSDRPTAFSILHELARPALDSPATSSIRTAAASFKTELESLIRENIHFVPIYTMTYFQNILPIYKDEIKQYIRKVAEIKGIQMVNEDFLQAMEGLNGKYQSSIVTDAENRYDDAIIDYEKSNVVYKKFWEAYEKELINLKLSESKLQISITDEAQRRKAMFFLNLISIGVSMGSGALDKDPSAVISGVIDMVDTVNSHLSSSIWSIGQAVKDIRAFVTAMEESMAAMKDKEVAFDSSNYMEYIERVATMQVYVEEWRKLTVEATKITDDPDVVAIPKATDCSRAMIMLSNAGMRLTEAMIAKAEMTRDLVGKKATYHRLKETEQQTIRLIRDLQDENKMRTDAMAALSEQAQDVRTDIYDVLLTFCQAYFFEFLRPCPDDVLPPFSAYWDDDLLLGITEAQKLAENIASDASPVSLSTVIEDDPSTSPSCEDVLVCPITFLRKHREFSYKVQMNNFDLQGFERYQVHDMLLKFENATVETGESRHLRLRVRSSGEFQGMGAGKPYNFLTTDVNRVFEYDVYDEDEIYAAFRVSDEGATKIRPLTPYTTWHVKVDERRSSHVNLTEVVKVKMTFIGDAVLSSARIRHA